MLPQSQPRKKRNSSKVNLLISFIFHAVLVLVLLYFAARQGLLGKQLKKISIEMVKEKPPEKPKEPPKVEPPKIEPPKVEPPKVADVPKVQPPPTVAPPTIAPPAAELPAFAFEGGKEVISGDPVQVYKGYIEYTMRQKWNRPENLADDNYVVEVAVSVDKSGRLGNPVWQKNSGNQKWDETVRLVFNTVTSIDRPPPTNFPSSVTIRFDVQQETEPVLQ